MSASPFPVPQSTVSFWRLSPHKLDDHRSTADLPAEVDIAIVGAGYAGASIAYHIIEACKTKNEPLPSIIILEARQACSGATGRNGGHLKPDPYTRPSVLAATHGMQAAAEIAAFETEHLRAVKDVIEKENIDCDFVLTRAVDVSMTEAVFEELKAMIIELRKLEVPAIEDVFYKEGAEAEQLSGVKGAKGVVTYTSGHLWPYKFVIGLLSIALAAGVNLQTHTPVSAVTKEPDADGLLTLTTERGSVRAKKIVYATNAYTSALLPEFKDKIIPARGICSHITTDRKPSPLLANSYSIRWGPSSYEYLIPRLDGSIIVGGARKEYYGDLGAWYGNVEDDKLIETAKDYFDGYMQRLYHGWENSGATTNKVWTGIMGYSCDGSPFVGTVPGRKNQYIAAGFSGHGMPQAFLSAKGVVSMLMDGADFRSTGVPSLFEASQRRLDNTHNVVLEAWEMFNAAASK